MLGASQRWTRCPRRNGSTASRDRSRANFAALGHRGASQNLAARGGPETSRSDRLAGGSSRVEAEPEAAQAVTRARSFVGPGVSSGARERRRELRGQCRSRFINGASAAPNTTLPTNFVVGPPWRAKPDAWGAWRRSAASTPAVVRRSASGATLARDPIEDSAAQLRQIFF
jgi:hypothetical protein